MGEVTILLDTHIFLWWLFDDSRLPVGIKENISNPANTILVSAASVWEITTKYRLGKLPDASQVAKNVPIWIDKAGFQSLVVTPQHAQLAGEWTLPHRDPFDRMLAAQAKLEKVYLASVDKELAKFPVQIMNT
ncbi:MAG: PIN domain-containing protein [Desulfuromusa sp.]|nr:PIN domain-containing protein [Desulfuromusa sp.]